MNISELTLLDWLTLAMCLYQIAESIVAICSMPSRYEMFCHKAKYVATLASAFAVGYYVFMPLNESTQWLMFGLMGTISLYVWPRMVWRFNWLINEIGLFLMDEEIHDEG